MTPYQGTASNRSSGESYYTELKEAEKG